MLASILEYWRTTDAGTLHKSNRTCSERRIERVLFQSDKTCSLSADELAFLVLEEASIRDVQLERRRCAAASLQLPTLPRSGRCDFVFQPFSCSSSFSSSPPPPPSLPPLTHTHTHVLLPLVRIQCVRTFPDALGAVVSHYTILGYLM